MRLLLVLVGSGIAVVTGAVSVAPQKPKPPTAVAAAPAASSGVLVYYFHVTSRCGTCRTIEAYAHETVTSRFAPDLQARRLEWRAVNVQEPELHDPGRVAVIASRFSQEGVS